MIPAAFKSIIIVLQGDIIADITPSGKKIAIFKNQFTQSTYERDHFSRRIGYKALSNYQGNK